MLSHFFRSCHSFNWFLMVFFCHVGIAKVSRIKCLSAYLKYTKQKKTVVCTFTLWVNEGFCRINFFTKMVIVFLKSLIFERLSFRFLQEKKKFCLKLKILGKLCFGTMAIVTPVTNIFFWKNSQKTLWHVKINRRSVFKKKLCWFSKNKS